MQCNAMHKKSVMLMAGVAALAAGGIASVVIYKRKQAKKKLAAAAKAPVPAASQPSSTATGTTSTALTAAPLLPPMTDSQAQAWATNIIILNTSKDYPSVIQAAAALYPIMNLSMSAAQIKQFGTTPPSDNDRSYIKIRYTDVPQPGGMTDDQAKVWQANLPIWRGSVKSTQAEMDAAILALYPLLGLHMTGYQSSKVGGQDDRITKDVTKQYAAIQAGGHASM